MILKTGVDLVEIERIRAAVSRHAQRFLERLYTPGELVCCSGRVESLAGRFAAKEAVSKALGEGIGKVSWREIEILEGEKKAPILSLHGEAARKAHEMGLDNWSVSISHSREYAVAFVVAVG